VALLNPLYQAVAWVIINVHALLSNVFDPDGGLAWGLSIVILVIVVRILLIPLFVKQITSMRRMQELSPKIRELQKKHKDDKGRQQQEVMKLYKEHGTNPLSGCLPILLQAPFFFALFQVLTAIAHEQPRFGFTEELVQSAGKALIFGAPIDAQFNTAQSTSVRAVIVVMIAIMTLTTFITQKQIMVKNTVTTADNPLAQQQKIMLYLFPVIFAVTGVFFPVGVLVYWLTTNVWSMGQQFYVIRRMPGPGTPAAAAQAERLARRARHAQERRGLFGRRSANGAQAAISTADGAIGPPGSQSAGQAGRSGSGSSAGRVGHNGSSLPVTGASGTGASGTANGASATSRPARQQPSRQPRSKRSGSRRR
jgi:YidC/Oxa1 family membrane protein insertase